MIKSTISEQQRANFEPTYLYIKQHQVTGKKYLGKTTRPDPINYSGSGTYWKNHLKAHENTINTLWTHLFTDIDELVSVALTLSELFDIVNSDSWANLIEETGLTGITSIQATKQNLYLVSTNKHNFQNGELTKINQLTRVKNGTHHWQTETHKNSISNREKNKAAKGEHISQILTKNGTHHWQTEKHKQQSSIRTSEINSINASRELYIEVKLLYETLNITKPKCLHMRPQEFLLLKKEELLLLKIS